jgi:hypothetical protein
VCEQDLPSYSPFLNENLQFFVSPVQSFGSGYVTLSIDERTFTLNVSEDGVYNVLAIGTRKDKDSMVFDEKGVEYEL